MRTRRSLAPGGANDGAAPAAKLRKVANKAGTKKRGPQVVVKPRVAVKRPGKGGKGSGAKRATAAAAAAAAPAPASGAAVAALTQPSIDASRRRSGRRLSVAAGSAGAAGNAGTSIADLSAESMQEIFLQLANQTYCREVLPLVCKRFRDLLKQPSPVWETLAVNFLEKGAVLSSEDGREDEALDADLGRRRRLLRSAVERWLQPRAKAIKRLLLMFSAMDPTHTFATGGRGLRQLFGLLAAGLEELRISSCSDIFHGRSFGELVGMQQLRVLAITCISAPMTAEDLAPLEQLKQLQSLTLHCSKQHEETAGPCFRAFPEVLFKLTGLRELAFTSTGVSHIPTGITRLKSLVALDVSCCPISFLPQNLWRCSELRHVRLNSTNMVLAMPHAWEPLVKLPRLETLELRDTKTRFLPRALNGLTALTALDLSDNIFEHAQYQGEDALGCLQYMPRLERLALRRSQMSTVPDALCHLSALTHLDISHNYLVDLGEALFLMRSLQELVAQGNSFPRLPQVLHKVPALESADLSFCIYMEAATPLDAMASEGFRHIRSLDLRKLLGAWKESSKKHLRRLNDALAAHGRPAGVIQF